MKGGDQKVKEGEERETEGAAGGRKGRWGKDRELRRGRT